MSMLHLPRGPVSEADAKLYVGWRVQLAAAALPAVIATAQDGESREETAARALSYSDHVLNIILTEAFDN